ncbi:ABC transporter permease [Halapricum salinum]|uniref:ABC transporter n=1 Tax=Halapricum salinum TaxID=1457250 RepID=A0A4D6HF75_9EURY|nr:ABC transporter permease subunit [Halapricum salinum]QCC52704.1 hypothetical protein DV733_16345 [Halapricum salinum]
MVWQAIARKEVRGLIKPRRRRAGLALVALVFVLGGYLLPTTTASPETADLAPYLTGAVTLVLPLFGLLLGYKTIVSERESGRILLLLSLPHSRLEAVFGKFLGRGGVLALVVTIGVVLASALVAYPFGSLQLGVMLAYLLVTLVYGLAFVSIGMSLSTFTRSGQRATAATFGVFFVFVVLWTELRAPFRIALDYLGLAGDGLPDWALFVYGLEPGMCYSRAVRAFFAGSEQGAYLGPDAPFYLGEWVALIVLLCWVVVPVAAGYRRFEVTDL